MSDPRWRRLAGQTGIELYRLGLRVRNKAFSLSISGAFDSFGSHTVLVPPIRLLGEARMAIGSGVFVGANCWLQVLEGEAAGLAPGPGVGLSLGDGTSIAGNCVLSAVSSITLGRDVSLARNVYISDHAHAYDDPSRAVMRQGITGVAPVSIGDGAWLGENVVVLPGVSVGRGSVVSANSVVTKDIPDFSVVAGMPARVVRRFGPSSSPDA